MYDELTAGDIQKMREEIDHRVREIGRASCRERV